MSQTDASHYSFLNYMHMSRWACYYMQIKRVLQLQPTTVLEIGPGDGVFGWYMKKNGVEYSSCDHAGDIDSTYKADLGTELLPIPDKSFDVVCAFQVLEHIPFDVVPQALTEIHRVSKRYVFLDIPEYSFHVQLLMKVPGIPLLAKHFTIPRPTPHTFDGFHHWEISKRGYSRKRVREVLAQYFTIVEEFTIIQNPKERFFLLEKKG